MRWSLWKSPSISFLLMLRIKPLELDAGILGGELPVHTDLLGITPFGPGGRLAAECFQIEDTPAQALLGQHAEFDFKIMMLPLAARRGRRETGCV